MTTIEQFLEARIADDEAMAVESRDTYPYGRGEEPETWICEEEGAHIAYRPDRVLAECRAKRAILQRHTMETRFAYDDNYNETEVTYCHTCLQGESCGCCTPPDPPTECPELIILAAVYADHPDFNPAWRAHQ